MKSIYKVKVKRASDPKNFKGIGKKIERLLDLSLNPKPEDANEFLKKNFTNEEVEYIRCTHPSVLVSISEVSAHTLGVPYK